MRLVLLVVATTSMILIAFLVPLGLMVRTVAADHAVNAAVTRAQSVTPLVATLNRSSLAQVLTQLNAENTDSPVTVFLADGTAVGAPASRSSGERLAATGRSIAAQTPGGVEVLVAVEGLPDGVAVVRVLAPTSELRHRVAQAWLLLGAVGLGLLAISALVAQLLARTMVRPLAGLAEVSDRLAVGDLAVRTTPGGPPEVRRVGHALNGLAERIGELLTLERESIANLSHRLRTPLTVLRIEAESLTDPSERLAVGAGLDALERTVTDVIREARRPTRGGLWAECDAAKVIGERAKFWTALAEEQQRRVSLGIPADPLPVQCTEEDLVACVDVLLDNIFAHTPEGTAFAIELTAKPAGGAHLTVKDEGPGFFGTPPTARGTSDGRSTGLGLDIAARVAQSSSGELRVNTGPVGGAWITLELGPPFRSAADGDAATKPPPRRASSRRHRARAR
jgi:signal transduction histidine kinase